MKYILTSICIALVMSCCGTKETTTTASTSENNAPLKGSFKVVQLIDVNLGMIEPTIIANTDVQQIGGYAGCNRYTVSYEMTESSLIFGDMAMTKAACIQGMEEEQKFAQAMAKVNRHTLEKGMLTLYQDQTVLIKAESTTM